MRTKLFPVLCACLFQLAYGQHDHSTTAKSDNAAFALIKGLAGEWQGSVKWTGARSDEYKMNAKYYLTGYGSAVIEDLLSTEGIPVMTSVYHLDGPDLRVTHFCGTGNQPRMKADAFNEKEKSVAFQFVDITNLANPAAGHVKGVELHFLSTDQFDLTFTFTASGKESYEHISLTRVKGS